MTASGYWVEEKSKDGNVFLVWRRQRSRVPQIPQQYLDCSIYLYQSVDAAETGERFGGSGCLVSVQSEFDITLPEHPYAVTNRHIAHGGFPVVRLNTIDGNTRILELTKDDWITHPDGDDLAVAYLPSLHAYPVPYSAIYHFVRKENVLTALANIGAGDDTFMVGRFVDQAGKQRNTPSLRFGNIAMLPFEKVRLADGFMQEAFLVEIRSIKGYSGSPVFVYGPEHTSKHRTVDFWGNERYETSISDLIGTPSLLGIDCGHWPKYKPVGRVENNKLVPHQLWKVESNTGLAIVTPAWRLRDLLDKEELAMRRKMKDHEHADSREVEERVVPDAEQPDDAFTRESYEDALRRASSRVSEHESEKTRTSE